MMLQLLSDPTGRLLAMAQIDEPTERTDGTLAFVLTRPARGMRAGLSTWVRIVRDDGTEAASGETAGVRVRVGELV